MKKMHGFSATDPDLKKAKRLTEKKKKENEESLCFGDLDVFF
jgi:hypothetical protein